MMDLALRGEDGPVALASVSERQKISLSYLEQLFGKLRRHKLVDSVRGPGGGYCIARSLDQVSVADIIRAVDEQLDATQCGGQENCHEEHRCMTHDLWSTLNSKMYDYLASVSLAELVARQKLKLGGQTTSIMEDKRPLAPPRSRAGREKAAAVI
jgi:Rrf2 family iron-sulfur cluster assembly transcriptional regulator